MGKSSRDKGARFERRIASMLSLSYGMDIRRTPMVLHMSDENTIGKGNIIKSDVYCVNNKQAFPLFVECKYRETYTVGSLFTKDNELYKEFKKTVFKKNAQPLNELIPVIVFKGGDFKTEMLLIEINELIRMNYVLLGSSYFVMNYIAIVPFCDFLMFVEMYYG